MLLEPIDVIRVVLVDDHPVVRVGIRQMLERAADIAVVGECDEGQAAIQLILKLQPTVVLLDMSLPDIPGTKVAQQLKASGYTGHILALSAYNDEKYILAALKYGVSGYLTKEEALTTVTRAIRGVAHGETGWLSLSATSQFHHRNSLYSSPRHNLSHTFSRSSHLSNREGQILRELAHGRDNQQIAKNLALAEGTVKNHVTAIYDKIGVHTRAEAVAWAWRHDILNADEVKQAVLQET